MPYRSPVAVHAEPSRVPSTSALPRPRSLPPVGAAPGGRRPALDGVRGIAVTLVLIHHFTEGFGRRPEGGFLGVDLFFVLSGYLITGLLVRSRERTGRLGLATFWLRRARRLLPPLLLLLIGLAALMRWAFPPEDWPTQRADALSALLYTANLHALAGLDAWGRQQQGSLLTHTWSLAVEEQFYLVWPLLLAALLAAGARLRRTRTPAVVACAVLAVASFSWLAHAALTGPKTFAYFDTRGRVGELLGGAALALLLPAIRTRLSRRLGEDAARKVWTACPVLGLLGLLLAVARLTQLGRAYYVGGAAAVTVLAALVIAGVESGPQGPAARALGTRPLAAVGKISYTLYLVSFPMMLLLPLPKAGGAGTIVATESVRLAFTFGVATVAYLALERPLLSGTFPGLRRSRPRLAVAGAAAVAAALVAVVAWTSLPGDLDTQLAAPAGAPCPRQSTDSLFTCSLSAVGPRWVVAGDQSGVGLAAALATVPGVAVTQAAWSGCGAGGLVPRGAPSAKPARGDVLCARDSAGLVARSLDAPGVTGLLVSDAGSARLALTSDGRSAAPGTDAHDTVVRSGLLRLVDAAASHGVRTVLLRQPPPSTGLGPLLAVGAPAGLPSADDDALDLRRYGAVLDQVAGLRPGWVSVVSVDDLVCPGGTCPALIQGLLVRHHQAALAPAFARRIAPQLAARMSAAVTPPRRAG
jgi:peptidoglycan/LPS O-acetylase OafA/YrhL